MLTVLALACLALIAHPVAHRRGAESGWLVAAKVLGAAAPAMTAILVRHYIRRQCR
jgi:hypothetical protein